MAVQARLYRVEAANGQVNVQPVWAQPAGGPLAGGYSHLVPVTIAGTPYLFAVDGNASKVNAFQVQEADPWLTPSGAPMDLGGGWDQVEALVIGNRPHLMTYTAQTGAFAFFPVNDNLSLDAPYRYARNHDPGQTNGFSMVKPVVIFGSVYYLCYGFDTGKVALYSLSVTASSPPGTPPLVSDYQWLHVWAKNWTRFAFFQLGGENFFLKTNVGPVPNVNIDHMFDDPTRRSVEVGTHMEGQLPNAKDLDIVRSFTLDHGDPYFVSYMKDGTTAVYRIWSDCQGFTATQPAPGATLAGCTQIAPVPFDGHCYLLFYAGQ
jgi:hypothetical protein